MTIKLYNTRTRRKEDFAPIDPDNVRMYVCGPTVYDRAHLGNARPVIVFDVLYRLLRHVYGPGHVTYVRNFTDVDDKINAEALRRQNAGEAGSLEDLIHQRTEETIAMYHADMDALGNLRPDHEPRATQYIGQMVAMTEDLIAKGHASSKMKEQHRRLFLANNTMETAYAKYLVELERGAAAADIDRFQARHWEAPLPWCRCVRAMIM